jgi:hypothetical protein
VGYWVSPLEFRGSLVDEFYYAKYRPIFPFSGTRFEVLAFIVL